MTRLFDGLGYALLLAALGLAAAVGDVHAHAGHHRSDMPASERAPADGSANALPQLTALDAGANHSGPAATAQRHCPSGPALGCHCGTAACVGAEQPYAPAPVVSLLVRRYPRAVCGSAPPAPPRRPVLLIAAPPRAPPGLSA